MAFLLLLLTLPGIACSGSEGASGVARNIPSLDCAACAIELEEVARLTDRPPDEGFRTSTRVTSAGPDRLILAPLVDGSTLAIVDMPSMKYRVVGRSGDGPGEFRRIVAATMDVGDSVVVLSDRMLTKLGPTGRYVTARQLRGRMSGVVMLRPGAFLLTGYQSRQVPFTIVDNEFNELDTIGTAAVESDSNEFRVAPDARGGFWAVRVVRGYELRYYSPTGELSRTLHPSSPWFSPEQHGLRQVPDPLAEKPLPRINGLSIHGDTVAWLIALVADSAWSPQRAKRDRGGERSRPDWDTHDPSRVYDSVVEVVDLRTGNPLARRSYDGILVGMTGSGLIWEALPDPITGVLALRLIRPQLKHVDKQAGDFVF